MTQDGYQRPHVSNWPVVVGCLTAILIVLAIAGLGVKAIVDNTQLQRDFNASIVGCVKNGGEPLACRAALTGKITQ